MVKLTIPILILLAACATERPFPPRAYQTIGSACVAAQGRLEVLYERPLTLRQHYALAAVKDTVGPICGAGNIPDYEEALAVLNDQIVVLGGI